MGSRAITSKGIWYPLVKIDESRFWSKVEKTIYCWLWTGATNKKGYGEITYTVDSAKRKPFLAHRIAYILANGWTDELVLHICDNTTCVKPDHLETGNHRLNNNQAVSRGRNAFGERNGRAKLTEQDVLDIVRLRDEGFSVTGLAQKYSVTPTAISSIKVHNWKHLFRPLDYKLVA